MVLVSWHCLWNLDIFQPFDFSKYLDKDNMHFPQLTSLWLCSNYREFLVSLHIHCFHSHSVHPQTAHSKTLYSSPLSTVDRDSSTVKTPRILLLYAHFQSLDQNSLACLPCLLYFHHATIRMWLCRDSVSRHLLSLKPSSLSHPGDLSLSCMRTKLENILFRELCVCICLCVCLFVCLRDRGGGAGIWCRRAFISVWVGSLWGPPQKLSISSIVLFPSLASLLSHVKLQKASYPPHPSSSLISHPFSPCSSVWEAYNPLRLFSKYFTTLRCSLRKLKFRQKKTGAESWSCELWLEA